MSFLEYLLQQLINAVSQGSLFALVAVGLSIIFSLLRLTNFAHGDMMMVGAFATLLMQQLGLPFELAVVAGIVVAGVVGIIIERIAYRPVRGAPDVTMLLTSVALTYILENLGILLFTSSPRNFPLPDWMQTYFSLSDGRITFTSINLLTFSLTLIALLFLGWFVTRTQIGLGMRAAAEDLTASYLVGINVNTVIVVAFVMASGFAGLAGVLWAAQAGVVEPHMGFTPLLKAFVAAIIGGFGSIPGAIVGGFTLGALEVLIQSLPSEWGLGAYRDALVFTLLIAFLLFRPGGILGVRQEVKL
jgi:branched-chain amino acid transport system permease protein